MLIRRGLGWMTGFPDGTGNWVSLPSREPASVIRVGRTELRRATYSLNKLRREFPRALPRIVGDVDRWADLHRSLIETLKPSVHGGSALPDSASSVHASYRTAAGRAATQAMSGAAPLRRVVCAFTWYCWLQPDQLRPAIDWLQTHHAEVVGIVENFGHVDGCVLLARLRELSASHGSKRLDPLLSWLADRRLSTVAVEQGRHYAYQVQAALNYKAPEPVPDPPVARLASEALAWVQWIAQQDGRTARRALEMFGLLHESVAMQAWEAWWRSIGRLVKRAQQLPTPPRRRHPAAQKLQAVRARLRAMGDATPAVVPAKRFFALLREEATQPNETQRRAIRRALQAMPTVLDDVPLRLAFLAHWSRLRRETERSKQNTLATLIGAFGEFVAGQDDTARALRPWQAVWSDLGKSGALEFARYTVDSELLDEVPRTRQIQDFFVALAMLQGDALFDEISGDDAETLVDVVLATRDVESAALALRLLKRESLTEKYLTQSLLRLAGDLCASDISQFATVTRVLLAADERVADLENTGKRLLAHWKKAPAEHLLLAVLDGHLMPLCATVLRGEVIRHAGGKTPGPIVQRPADKIPPWIRSYPKELRDVLRELDACDANARATAARILQKDFPDPKKIRLQISRLEERVADGDSDDRLTARIRKLEAWLSKKQLPGTGRLANLAAKLRQAATRAMVIDWSSRVDARFRTSLPRLLQAESLPDWAENLEVLELLLPIGGLSASFRNLIAELLKHRSGDPPWDLRDLRDNRRFLNKMDQRGVNMTPWIDDAPVTYREAGDEPIRFTLERDPLEVFAMGGRFKTCLSPGSFNYFSVFANAADVNKQVLYGRRKNGRVVARCLLALTGEGGIVTFHAYCHDKSVEFTSVVREYVKQLAQAMNTVVLARGVIPRLVAPDWYDDGPIDVTDQFAFLTDKRFLERLATVPLEELVDFLADAISPLALDELTLPMFVRLDVFVRRPELVRPLYPIVLHNERLPPDLILQVVELLNRCEQFRDAERLSPRLLQQALAAHRDGYDHVVNSVLDALARCSPTRALSLLRKTRGKNNRNWSQETDGYRLCAGAVASLALHRPRQAQRLLESVVKNPCCKTHKDQSERLLREMAFDG